MRKCMTIVAVVAMVLTCVSGAQADVVMETVTVGYPGNTGEWSGESYGGGGPDALVGAVDYAYNIGTYEVTAGQYRDFLNAVCPTGSNPYGLHSQYMDILPRGCQITWNAESSTWDFSGRPSGTEADWVHRPVNYVNWGDAARFANWMHNGQPTGELTGDPIQDGWLTEDGSYFLDGATSGADLMAIARESGATWVIPSEDEWYKAAYHYNDGPTGNYFDYPTSSDSVPSNDLVDPDPGNNATFYASGFTIDDPYWRTEVGAHGNSESPYGTFDQGGNVWEWNETAIGSYRGQRGGSLYNYSSALHAADRTYYHHPTSQLDRVGFRLAYVPEPATIALLAFGAVSVLGRRRR